MKRLRRTPLRSVRTNEAGSVEARASWGKTTVATAMPKTPRGNW